VEDAGNLHEIDRICFPADIAFTRAELLFHLNHPKSIARVARGPARIIGFVLARIETDYQAHVLTLDVIPEARRSKVGTLLMDELHRELDARQIAVAVLEVSATNLPARRLYEGLGYHYLERIAGYYRGRDDAYRMGRLMKRGVAFGDADIENAGE